MLQPLTAWPRDALTEAEVIATLALDHAPLVRHGVTVLDTSDTETGETVPFDLDQGGEVVWSYRPPDPVVDGRSDSTTDVAAVRRTATLTLAGDVFVPIVARRFRLWTELLSPSGTWVRFHLGVFLATSPPMEDDGIVVRQRLTLADKTYRYARRTLADPLVVDAGENVVDWVRADLGSTFGETAFNLSASDITLDEAKVFEPGMSYLDVYNALLETAGYDQLSSDENGRPSSVPLADLAGRGPEVVYGPSDGKIVVAGSVESLIPDLPNQVRFIARQGPSLAEEGNGIATRTNDSTGPASVDQRGEVVETRVEVDAEDQDALEAIADADSQRYFAGGGLRFTGRVGLNPRHGDRDVVGLDKPRLGLAGAWLLTEWRYPLKRVTSEEAVLMPITCEMRV